MTREKLIEMSLDTVNELLPGADAIGAYCLGLICALAWQDNIEPPRMLLTMAVRCPSIVKAAELYEEFRIFRIRT